MLGRCESRFSLAEAALAVEAHGASHAPGAVALRNLDVVIVLVAMVPVIALGAPALGYIIGAAGWVLQRLIAATDQRWLRRVTDPIKQLGANLGEAFARIWLLAGAIVLAAVVGSRQDALTAALVIFGAYSVAFVIKLMTGAQRASQRRAIR
jgi:hypothetical protein